MKDFLKLLFFGVSKAPKMKMYNPDTGEKTEMTFGFNLQMILLGSFFGLPLFFKRLWGWAWGVFALSSVQVYTFYQQFRSVMSARTVEEYEAAMNRAASPAEEAVGWVLIAVLILLSFKANQWAVKRLLKKGWHFENPQDPLVQKAVKKWKISKHYLKPPKETDRL